MTATLLTAALAATGGFQWLNFTYPANPVDPSTIATVGQPDAAAGGGGRIATETRPAIETRPAVGELAPMEGLALAGGQTPDDEGQAADEPEPVATLKDIGKRLFEKAGCLLGSSAGAAVGAKIGFMVGGPLGAVLGGAIGSFLGGGIGEVLGGKVVKPPPVKP